MLFRSRQSPQQPVDNWFYLDAIGQEFGPVPTHGMRELFLGGNFPPGRDLLVRMAHWTHTGSVGELYPDGEPFDGPPCVSPMRPQPCVPHWQQQGQWNGHNGHEYHGPSQSEAWMPNTASGFKGGGFHQPSGRNHHSSQQVGRQVPCKQKQGIRHSLGTTLVEASIICKVVAKLEMEVLATNQRSS